ncbi:hypothetical protein FGIG_02298 [Fasciola gigantica]|uniref:Protein SAAL1 n=1 Tax=Fasciola gigantica TaxID=46835 RepID=A0A504YF82_FASGI|nr:hypothetical protein FGIG_02298 [Fasciola gigantica]
MCQGMSHRNPSPPAELAEELQHVDQIGDTAYSKCWLYALLMKLLNLVKSSSTSDLSEIHELDQELEEQLCCLWDLTVNHNVLPHLEDFDLVPIFTDVLTCHQYPRLLEIIVGILANLAYNPKACRQMTDNDVLVNRVISLFYSRDTPTLTEVCR